jgi:large subunit ribosomal protein L10
LSATAVVKHRVYPKKKVEALQKLTELAERYPIIGIAKLTKTRAQLVNALRKRLRSKVVMLAVKNKLAKIAFSKVKKHGLDKMAEFLTGQNMLLFTDLDPFELISILDQEKVDLPARPGDVATSEIVVPAGNTGIPPGPVLSEFKEAGISTKIEGGSIWVSKPSVVARPGDVISPKLAGLLSRLGLKPIRAGLQVDVLYWNGRIVPVSALKVSVEEVAANIAQASLRALVLSVETGYPTPRSVEVMMDRAVRQALSLTVESGYVTEATVGRVLAVAYIRALVLKRSLEQHGLI